MAAIDFPPPMRDVPPLGTFVVVALDPVGSLAALDDPVVEAAARRMTPQKRLVMVSTSLQARGDAMIYKFDPVGSGLPRDEWASIPIHPTTAHPEGRVPVHPSRALPVDIPYFHTAETFEGQVSRIYLRKPTDICCCDEDRGVVGRSRLDDMTRINRERRAAESDDELYEDGSQAGSESIWGGEVPTFMEPMYHMWLHINPDETFADPSTLQDEIEQLCALETKWRERREAETVTMVGRLQEWRAAVDAPPDAQEEQEPDPRSLGPDDVTIWPGDAVGEGRECIADTAQDERAKTSSPPYNRAPSSIVVSIVGSSDATGDHQQADRSLDEHARLGTSAPSAASRSQHGSETVREGRPDVVSHWARSAQGWIGEGARFMRELSGVWSALIPGGYW